MLGRQGIAAFKTMATIELRQSTDGSSTEASGTQKAWAQKYRERHRLVRIQDFPRGIRALERIRIYRRGERYFLLQWWEPGLKRTLSQRVSGDLIDAIAAARQVQERMEQVRSSGIKPGKYKHTQLAEKYHADLERRADAGEIDPHTVQRYRAAIGHYLAFAEQPVIAKAYPQIARVDRDFQLQFSAFLANRLVRPNGRANSRPRPMQAQDFVRDVVRGMFVWAADPDRGGLLSDAFRNPFVGDRRQTASVAADLMREPDITTPMAAAFLATCDAFQLSVFAPMLLYGLRPGELGWLFWEQVDDDWLKVCCNGELGYFTKGRRDKRFPRLACINRMWRTVGEEKHGLIYRHRRLSSDSPNARLQGSSLAEVIDEYHRRCRDTGAPCAAEKQRIRNRVLRDAGQLTYHHVKREFEHVAHKLAWPASATPKDLRHLFATALENAGTPEFFRRYLMGQSFGRAAIVTYTHITPEKLCEHYERAANTELAALVDAIEQRADQLGIPPYTPKPTLLADYQ
jgi:integrase